MYVNGSKFITIKQNDKPLFSLIYVAIQDKKSTCVSVYNNLIL